MESGVDLEEILRQVLEGRDLSFKRSKMNSRMVNQSIENVAQSSTVPHSHRVSIEMSEM